CSGPLPTAIYALSLHDALPISTIESPMPTTRNHSQPDAKSAARLDRGVRNESPSAPARSAPRKKTAFIACGCATQKAGSGRTRRSAEHTSELQSRENLVCRLML